MIKAIETDWSASGFTVKVVRDGKYPNIIDVVPCLGQSNVVGHSRGIRYAGESPWVAAHESDHFMKFNFNGRDDMYDLTSHNSPKSTPVAGWEGAIMAQYRCVVDQRTRDNIIGKIGCVKRRFFWQR